MERHEPAKTRAWTHSEILEEKSRNIRKAKKKGSREMETREGYFFIHKRESENSREEDSIINTNIKDF